MIIISIIIILNYGGLRPEGGSKHHIFSFDIYERAPEDEKVGKNCM